MNAEQVALTIIALFIAKRLCDSLMEITDQVGYKRYKIEKLNKRIGYLNNRILKSDTLSFYVLEQGTSLVVLLMEVYILYVLLKALNVIG